MTLFWIVFIYLLAFGACVGSFLNVVIYRVPEGRSIVSPPSACPKCGHRLAWYDNVPVLGWLWLRGKCRYCANPISIQYPVIEALTGLLFAGVYLIYYATELRPPFGDPGLLGGGLPGAHGTWHVFLVHLFLIGSLIAATLIDARLFIIPLGIPWLATVVAVVVLPGAAALGWLPAKAGMVEQAALPIDYLVPVATTAGVLGAGGGILGWAIALLLLRLGVLATSFADEAKYLRGDGTETTSEVVAAYPHPRREMVKEFAFVGWPLVGLLAGLYVGLRWGAGWGAMPEWLGVLGGVTGGYLVGGGLVWLTRIGGTLAFGKEAMGLGDVHLLAAVGAVLGPLDTVLAFFIAPFMGLLWYAVMLIVGRGKPEAGGLRMLPYGPFLAGGALVVMTLRNPIFEQLHQLGVF